MIAPRPSFIRRATGIVVVPSTTCTVTGIARMVSRLGAPEAASPAEAACSGAASSASFVSFMRETLQGLRSARRGPPGRSGRGGGIEGGVGFADDDVLDLESVTVVLLAQLAVERAALLALDPDLAAAVAGEVEHLTDCEPGNFAERHFEFIENRGQPDSRLSHAELHLSGPFRIGRHGSGGALRQLLADG